MLFCYVLQVIRHKVFLKLSHRVNIYCTMVITVCIIIKAKVELKVSSYLTAYGDVSKDSGRTVRTLNT